MKETALLFILFLMIDVYQSALGGEILDKIVRAKVIRVGTPADYQPYSYLDPSTQKHQGIDIELAQDLGRTLGVKVEFVKTSWKSLMKDYEAGGFEIAMGGISVTSERAQKALFSHGYHSSGKTPIALCSSKNRFDRLDKIDHSDVTIIVNAGGTNQKFLSKHIRHAKIVVHNDNTTIFGELLAGRAHLMITDQDEVILQTRLHPELCSTMPGKSFEPTEKAIMISHDAELKKLIDQWLKTEEISGKLKELFAKYQ